MIKAILKIKVKLNKHFIKNQFLSSRIETKNKQLEQDKYTQNLLLSVGTIGPISRKHK